MRSGLSLALTLVLLTWVALLYLPAETQQRWFIKLFLVELSAVGLVLALLLALVLARSWSVTLLGLLLGAALAQPWIATAQAAMTASQRLRTVLPDPHPLAEARPSWPLSLPWQPLECVGVNVESEPFGAARPALMLDVYRRRGAVAGRPWVLIVHGGAWRSGSRREQIGFNCALAARGYVVLAADYRYAPEWIYPAQRKDLETAVDWALDGALRLGLDPSNGHLIGRSAGGQLALDLAYRAPPGRFRSVTALYAPADMVYAGTAPFNRRIVDATTTLKDYLGVTYAEDQAPYRSASPLLRVRPGLPATLLLHGPPDGIVAHTHSERLIRALDENGVPAVLASLPWMEHGADVLAVGPHAWASLQLIEAFLARTSRAP